jgi:hypothetical protein
MGVRVKNVDMHVMNVYLRMPFRFGIATLEALPHLFVSVDMDIDGEHSRGVASENLPPRWFTKRPEASVREEFCELLDVARHASELAAEAGDAPTVYELWRNIYAGQTQWAATTSYPPLLWSFGVTLVERAMISAFCRAKDTTFHDAIRTNALGIVLADHHERLAGHDPAEYLPKTPLRSIIARHTVGLGDPLLDTDIVDRLDDGLPQSLEASICQHGLTHFKIKLWGDADKDREWLARIASVLEQHAGGSAGGYAYTLDGNENYGSIEPFRELWESLSRDRSLAPFVSRLLFAEQAFHRDIALGESVRQGLAAWPDSPPMIIDESDDSLDALDRALGCGYVGTSHKNCKGVFKSVANRCLIEDLRRSDPDGTYVMSAEDLSNIAPVGMLEDLAVVATLGIEHAERNGHHYFRGASMLPDSMQRGLLESHGDLYVRHEQGFPTLDIRNGAIRVGSVVDAPFGMGFEPDVTGFTPLDEWDASTLGDI